MADKKKKTYAEMTEEERKARGWGNLSPWEKGQSGNPKGKPKGARNLKNQLKDNLKVLKWMEEDAELAEMVNSLDNKDMFDALKKTAFALFTQDPTDDSKYDRAYKAVAEDREYTEGKKVRTEVDQRITQVNELTIEELEAELAEYDEDEDPKE